MIRLMPRTLFAQMLAILLAGLAVSYVAGTWIFAADRQAAVRALGGFAATQRIANLARLIDEAPPVWRARIVAAASDATLRVSLDTTAPAVRPSDAARTIAAALAAQLPPTLARSLRVAVRGATGMPSAGGGMMHAMPMAASMMGDFVRWRTLTAVMRLDDGQWLSFAATLPEAGAPASWRFLTALASMAAIVLLSSVWAMRRVTAPLALLADAADRLGRDVNAPPIAEAGSVEMREAARGFNEMQTRVQGVIAARTRLLAALSHDLRTPLTLLRLRTESLAEGEERERMLGSIAELEAMIAATLQLARDEAASEPRKRTDLAALVGAMVDDMADTGRPVRLLAVESVVLDCRSMALRRAVGNLIDNAIRYAGAAEVSVQASPDAVTIVVEDRGPGIPQAERQGVFEPFHRLDPSRSRDTGGVGLGLAIARAAARAHGGDILLADRPGGGLRVELRLPRVGSDVIGDRGVRDGAHR